MVNKSKRKAAQHDAAANPANKKTRTQQNSGPSSFHLLQLPAEIIVSPFERALYRKDTAGTDCSFSLLWAAIHNRPATANKAIAAGAQIDGARPKPAMTEEQQDSGFVPHGYGSKALVPLAFCGQSPLFIAAYKGYLEVTKVLMQHGAALDWKTDWQNTMTAPSAAAAKGHLSIAKHIHESGYNLSKDRSYHGTILHCAAHHGRIAMVQYLVDECRVDIDAKDDYGRVALQVAVSDGPEGVEEVVKFLLGRTPANHPSLRLALGTAIGNGRYWSYKMNNLLLQSGKVDCTQVDETGRTPLGLAAAGDRGWITETLLKYDCIDPNLPDAENQTPLMVAKAAPGYRQEALMALLKSTRVNHAHKQAMGSELFRIGCRVQNQDLLLLLLDLGIAGDNYTKLFHLAGETRAPEVVARLIKDYGVPVDSLRQDGLTPLQYAFLHNKPAYVEFYARNGADTSLPGSSGLPMLHCAAKDGPVDHIRALLRGETDPNLPAKGTHETPLHLACLEGRLERVSVLLQLHADPMRLTADGLTAYHYAIRSGSEKVVRWLMGASHPPRELFESGRTLLHEACQSGNTAIVRAVLKQQGPNVAPKAENGETPLHVAMSGGHAGIVQVLLGKGADMLAVADDGSTPASIAEKSDDKDLQRVVAKFSAKGLDSKAKKPQAGGKMNGKASPKAMAGAGEKAATIGTRRSARNKA